MKYYYLTGIVGILLVGYLLFYRGHQQPPTVVRELRIGYVNTVSNLPLFVAFKKNYFEENGMNVSTKIFESSDELIKSLIANETDFVVASTFAAFQAEDNSPGKLKIMSVNKYSKNNPFSSIIVRNNSNVERVDQLGGMKIAFFPGATSPILTTVALDNLLQRDYGIELVQIPPRLWLEALSSGQVDAVISYEPYTTSGVEQGTAKILYRGLWEKNLMDNIPLSVGLVTADFMHNNPESAKKIEDTLDKSINFIRSNETEARIISMDYLSIPESVALNMIIAKWEVGNNIVIANLQNFHNFMYDYGVLNQKSDTSKMVYK